MPVSTEVSLTEIAMHAREIYCRVQGIDMRVDFEDLSITERSAWEAVTRFVAGVIDHDDDDLKIEAYKRPYDKGWRPPNLRGAGE